MSEAKQTKASPSLLRAILGVIGGAIVWMFGFLILARILVMLWPAYGVPARVWTQTQAYTFTAPMSVCNVSFWILVEIAAGWVVAAIARRSGAVQVLAALVMAYLCFLHLYFMWPKFPWWYNLAVALSSGPAVLWGGRLGLRLPRRDTPAGAIAA